MYTGRKKRSNVNGCLAASNSVVGSILTWDDSFCSQQINYGPKSECFLFMFHVCEVPQDTREQVQCESCLIYKSQQFHSILLNLCRSGAVADHLVLNTGLEGNNYVIKAIWLPGSQTQLALVTSDFVKIFDLSKDLNNPMHHFLVPSGKVRFKRRDFRIR